MLAFLTTAICFLSFTQASVPSPAATADLICHTSNPAECYPREFVPSDDFRIVHDDQSIPKGLHVRLNLATGVKEAKINVPTLDDSEQRYSDLTVEVPVPEEKEQSSDLINVEEPEEEPSPPSIHDQSTPEHQHPIRPPPFHPEEHSTFTDSISIIKFSSPKDDPETQLLALSNLQDLSHSYHWGVTLARDRATSHKIFQLLSASSPSPELRSAAALLLGTAVHNNPDALTAALTHFYNDEWPTGPLEAVLVALVHESLPKLLQRMVFLLSGLCQDPAQLSKFIDAGGLDTLRETFYKDTVKVDSNGKLQAKIANFVLDHFLQMDEVTLPLSDNLLTDQDSIIGMESDETNLPEEAKAVQEVESKLEGEDSWVLANEDKEQNHPPKDVTVKKERKMAQTLQAWCSAFPQGIYGADHSRSEVRAVNALANLEDAHHALERTLKANGCSCEKDCSSSD